MWKRLPGYHRSRDRQIGPPTLIQTTFDEETLDKIPHLAEVQGPSASTLTSAGPRIAEERPTELHAAPRAARPVSQALTASSMYSQTTPELQRHDGGFTLNPTTLPVQYEVSPPSTPDGGDAGRPSPPTGTVSPIELSSHLDRPFLGDYSFLNQIEGAGLGPVTTPEPSQHTDATSVVADSASVATRWDDFMRESRASDARSPPVPKINRVYLESPSVETQAPAGDDATHANVPRHGTTLAHSGPDPFRLNSQARRLAHQAEPATTPELHRNNTVNMATPSSSPSPSLSTEAGLPPRKSSKRLDHFKAGVVNRRLLLRLRGNSALQISELELDEDDEIKPTLPLKAGRNSPSQIVSSPTALPTPTHHSYLDRPENHSGTDWSTSMTPRGSLDRKSVGYIGLPTTVLTPRPTPDWKNVGQEAQPQVSRFDDRTYIAGTTPDTPPDTPVPDPGHALDRPTIAASARPSRSRPSSKVTSNTKATARKPISSDLGVNSPSGSITRSSITKGLPPSPPELESSDLTTNLEAQLNALRYRRANLQRIIADLTRHLTNALGTPDRRVRQGMHRTIDDCKEELDEVQCQQHEIGIRLHHAWRRREKQECSDKPTGLWIRRVTH